MVEIPLQLRGGGGFASFDRAWMEAKAEVGAQLVFPAKEKQKEQLTGALEALGGSFRITISHLLEVKGEVSWSSLVIQAYDNASVPLQHIDHLTCGMYE